MKEKENQNIKLKEATRCGIGEETWTIGED